MFAAVLLIGASTSSARRLADEKAATQTRTSGKRVLLYSSVRERGQSRDAPDRIPPTLTPGRAARLWPHSSSSLKLRSCQRTGAHAGAQAIGGPNFPCKQAITPEVFKTGEAV